MRTTLTIDDDIAARLEDLRLRKGFSFKKTVNLLLRDGLRAQAQPKSTKQFRSKPQKLGLRVGYDATRLNQLADDLESEAIAGKLNQRRLRCSRT